MLVETRRPPAPTQGKRAKPYTEEGDMRCDPFQRPPQHRREVRW